MVRYPSLLARFQLRKMNADITDVTIGNLPTEQEKTDIKNNIFLTVPHLRGVKLNRRGEVYIVKSNTIKNQHLKLKDDGKCKYVHVRAPNKKGVIVAMYLHILLAKTFIPIPKRLKDKKLEVNHIDGDRRNFSLDNLEWTLKKENILHSVKVLGNTKTLLKQPRQVSVVDLLINKTFTFYSLGDASRHIGVNPSTLHEYLHREEGKNILKKIFKVNYKKCPL